MYINTDLQPVCAEFEFPFSFAFQPIVDTRRREIIAFEALVRGPAGEPAEEILALVTDSNAFQFEQVGHQKAIQMARNLGLRPKLNMNMYPLAPEQAGMNIRATLQAAMRYHFPHENIVLELTEYYKLVGHNQLLELIRMYRTFGFHMAIDDFGTGFSGLSMLVEYQPDYIKLDRFLISGVHQDPIRQAVVRTMKGLCDRLQIHMIAEGVELAEEFDWLARIGVYLFQGYYFARPVFENLPEVPQEVYFL